MITQEDRRGLALALSLGRRARGLTRPNPHVGCVLSRDGTVVGSGFHARAGEPHAEAIALAAAGDAARGATLYVNLEPCCHHGRTPPCTQAITAAGVSRVVACHRDPNPLVNGHGFEELRLSGVEVACGALEDEALELNEGYLCGMVLGRPFGILKAAQTLDGKLGAAHGASRHVSSEWARGWARDLRADVDAVAVGVGTVLADDPDLRPATPGRDVLRVVLDSQLRTPPTARLLSSAVQSPVLVVATDGASAEREQPLRDAGADVARVPAGADGHVHLPAAAALLLARGVQSVLYEGGGRLHGALLASRLVDRALVVVAPRVLGGASGTPLAHRDPAPALEQAWGFAFRAVRRLGEDLLCEAEITDRRTWI